MVPCGSTPVARLNLAKNEAAEEVLRRRLLLFVVLKTRQLLVPVPPEYWIFKMASLCYSMVQHFLPFQYVTVAVFRAFWYVIYLLTITDSEIGKKTPEEDLKQTRRDRPIFKKKVGNYDKCEFSNFFLFQRAKMIISVLVTWRIVDCNLAVRVLLSF